MTHPKAYVIMLVLSQPVTLSRDALEGALRARMPDREITVEMDDDRPGSAIVLIDRALCTMMNLPHPIPAGTMDGAVGRNLLWSSAAADLAGHRAHIIVGSGRHANDVGAFLQTIARLIALCEALISLSQTIGVYFCAPEAVYRPEVFLEKVKADRLSMTTIPLDLCVRLHFYQRDDEPGLLGCWTTGLFDLVGREIEMAPSALDVEQIGGTILGAAYLLTHGSAFNDGDTMGNEDGSGAKIVLSLADRGEIVIRPAIRMRLHQGYA